MVARCVASASFASAAVVLVESAWATSGGGLISATLLVLPAFVIAMGIAWLLRTSRRPTNAALLGVGAIILGTYLANVLLVAPPFARPTLIGYGVTALVGCGAYFLALRFPFGRARSSVVLRWWGATLGLALAAVDAKAAPLGYPILHALCAAGALSGWVAFAVLQRIPVLAVAALWVALGLGARTPWVESALRHPGLPRRTVIMALDVGGVRRELAPEQSCPEEKDSVEVVGSAHASPRVIVLVTLDAFRCGFGRIDRPELRDACPELTTLLSHGRSRLDAHATAPETYRSVAAMQLAGTDPLAARLRRKGFHTRVIANHTRILSPRGVRESFDQIDEELANRNADGTAVTSEETTNRALAALDSFEADADRHFLWVHYYDPHEPYVLDPKSPWRFSELDAYLAEVRRTDAAIARLLRSTRLDSTAFIVSADHGEELGEHGAATHGGDLYEEASRIPVLVFTHPETLTVPDSLPNGSREIGDYILSLADDRSFASSPRVLLEASPPHDRQRGLVSGQWKLIEHRTLGYVELYDLTRDPMERADLSATDAADVHAMRCALAADERK
jgi:hypothetical protein